jgi:methenyltetrahydrofolate cyclohydrolase
LNRACRARIVVIVPAVRDPLTLTTAVSESTLERFREATASAHPTPAGVAVAAVSASFAFGLLAKGLAVSARRDAQSVTSGKLEPLAAAARAESSRMLQLASDDMAAFEAYLAAARLPRSSDRERRERQKALDAALRQAIDLPLAGARSAAAGVRLCAEAASVTHLVVLADLATAVTLLAGALRAFLLCAHSNVSQLAPQTSSHRELLASESNTHQQALRQAQELLDRVAAALEAARAKR